MAYIPFYKRFLKYYLKAQTKYHIHSPFVYQFCEEVLEDDRFYYAFEDIETLRKLLLLDKSLISITDLGAGSQLNKSKKRTVANLVKHSATGSVFCQILFKIINQHQSKKLLELGTSIGISSLYQASAAEDGQLITLEGCKEIAKKTRKNFHRLNKSNIELIEGNFEETLPIALEKLGELDYVFIDGNHRKGPTLNYFEQCLKRSHSNTIMVFDDIHWSTDMEEAWEQIKQHPKVRLTIDLFFCGIVFFRKEQKQKEHFTLIKSSWKPFGIGLLDLFRG